MTSIDVDFTKTTGPMNALHGINNSPVVYNAELPELREAGIPYARMHDAGGTYGGTYLVDIPNVLKSKTNVSSLRGCILFRRDKVCTARIPARRLSTYIVWSKG